MLLLAKQKDIEYRIPEDTSSNQLCRYCTISHPEPSSLRLGLDTIGRVRYVYFRPFAAHVQAPATDTPATDTPLVTVVRYPVAPHDCNTLNALGAGV